MTQKRPLWPTDDQVRELEGDRELTDDGRKVDNANQVGVTAPDADPEPVPPAPRKTARP
jgi:hypothetical protein